jgi:hypothetical protein
MRRGVRSHLELELVYHLGGVWRRGVEEGSEEAP